jgi:hypothetical protein
MTPPEAVSQHHWEKRRGINYILNSNNYPKSGQQLNSQLHSQRNEGKANGLDNARRSQLYRTHY